MIDVDKTIATTVKTGKVLLGVNNAIKSAKLGRAKLVVLASNCPRSVMEDVKYYARLSDVPVIIYKGTSIDLGAVCGKPFMVSALTVREPGDSDIIKLIEGSKETMKESETLDEGNA
jgi:large subunit ribosomal protein L30e